MNGFIVRIMWAGCLTGVLGAMGCCTCGYHDVVDPCYPERYNFVSRQEVIGAIAPQVQNGHVLDQTVWNSYFDPGTDRLTPGGMDQLAYMARRRPMPDPMIYLQTAQDLTGGYDQDHPEKFVQARNQLDSKRTLAVQTYLTAYTAGHVAFTVVVHDPPETGMSTIPANVALQKSNLGYDGILRIEGGLKAGGGG